VIHSNRFGFLLCSAALFIADRRANADEKASPLVIGETFTIDSKVLKETRRINVYLPPGYVKSSNTPLPVLHVPDGGLAEDFLHIAGLVQVSVSNGTMRPFLLVGIENTERRRDLTGPTESEDDKKIAPRVGGSAAFRKFLREELMPQVKNRYRTTKETAIMGESLAGLFVVETFLLEPDLFNTYIAIDPSLWWNNAKLVNDTGKLLQAWPGLNRGFFLARSGEERVVGLNEKFWDALNKDAPRSVHPRLSSTMYAEKHATIYHPAAMQAFRDLFKPGEK